MLSSVLLFFSFSASEIMFILFVALILFGGDKFPEIARGLGKGIREFKDMSDGVKREIHQQINSYDSEPRRETETTAAPVPPVEPEHQPVAENHVTDEPAPPYPVTTEPVYTHAPAAAAPSESAETPKKPDLSQPPNTISHQSY